MLIEFPGLVDLQVNGFAGVDFNTADVGEERLRAAIAALAATGVTRVLPTLITSTTEHFARCAGALLELQDEAIAGLHMEGPYISPADGARGAHRLEYCSPASVDDFRRRQEAARGRIVLVTLAPEVPGALPLIELLVRDGIRVAIGHTAASASQIADAVSAGATLSTHLGNGCPAILPRHPNVIWEQLAADDLFASVIADGHHLPPSTLKVIVRTKTPARTILVTDAIAAAGCGPGRFRIGDVDVEVGADLRASLTGTPFLAGSALTMPAAIGHAALATGLDVSEMIAMASDVPARYLGIRPAGRVRAEWDASLGRLAVTSVEPREPAPQGVTPVDPVTRPTSR